MSAAPEPGAGRLPRGPRRGAAWALVLVLALWPALAGGAPREAAPAAFARLAADLDWIRFQRARRAGDAPAALRHASRALERAPRETAGWELLVGYLGYELAAPAASSATPDDPAGPRADALALRRGWLAAALALTQEGERRGADGHALRTARAVLLWNKALHDPALGLEPDDPAGDAAAGATRLLERSAAAFRSAGEEALAAAVLQRAASPR